MSSNKRGPLGPAGNAYADTHETPPKPREARGEVAKRKPERKLTDRRAK